MNEDKRSSLGLEGNDPVILCEENILKRGSYELRAKVGGITYCFINEENRGRFKRSPSHFLPQFGGHCAFACGLYGGLVPGSLEHRRNVSGKLFLFAGAFSIWAWERFPSLMGSGQANYEKKFKIKVK